jgi:hypothetical protein
MEPPMSYQTIIPAVDWFFVHANSLPAKPYTVHRLACWALTPDGRVEGLLAVSSGVGEPRSGNCSARLVAPPSVQGEYLHLSELSEAMRACIQPSTMPPGVFGTD